MELTHEQLQLVENYLDKKDITYIDIRTEVFDHIVSDIETKMTSSEISFEKAFNKVTNKWNTHLEQSSSFYFGSMFTIPKIVLEKAKKSFKKYYIIGILVFLIPFLSIRILNPVFTEEIKNTINLFLQTLTVLSFIVFTILMIIKSKNKTQTTYRFILNTQSLGFICSTIVLIDLDFFTPKGILDSILVGLLSTFVFTTYTYYHFLKKHKEAIKKYKIS
ncbi:hypothetical protein [Polaribacter sp. Q13]|uniref:hypothetical protein n=1 Tax=Polaribacter sp. Q13 TaxID=2806551 RepID=UPI00193B1678|nr:hypothetical protein [Polaribacter sp. Q13]QVY64386.1 hypothetical protein JOP69_11465 [Polaribacter sp. Q13]